MFCHIYTNGTSQTEGVCQKTCPHHAALWITKQNRHIALKKLPLQDAVAYNYNIKQEGKG